MARSLEPYRYLEREPLDIGRAKEIELEETIRVLESSGSGDLVAANNLSDVASVAAARINLGLAVALQIESLSYFLGNKMATVKGVLGQAAPGATSEADLYTVPASKNATIRVISTNRSTAGTVRISVGIDGAVTANEQYMAYDFAVGANETKSTTPFMVGSTDVVRVYASSANFSFSCVGIEQDD